MKKVYEKLSTDNFFRLGYEYQASGNLYAAAECFVRSIEKRPSAEAHTYLAMVLFELGDLDQAISECKKALQLDKKSAITWNDLGVYNLKRHHYKEAMRCLKKACVHQHEEPEYPHFNLGLAYARQGMLIKAQSEAKKALKIKPNFLPAKTLLQTLETSLH